MISVQGALEKIVSNLPTLSDELVSLPNALGRILAKSISSRTTSPPFAISAMDGYAVRFQDVKKIPTSLKQIGVSATGRPFLGTLDVGHCVRIYTGALLPDGADTVVIQEDTTTQKNMVTITSTSKLGNWIRKAGLDFSKGDCLLDAGQMISARDIGLLAAMNIVWVAVRRRPQVAIISTGDELVLPGEPAEFGQIYSSNGLFLESFIKGMGASPVNLGIAPDTKTGLNSLLSCAVGKDILVTSGGASVGDFDFVREALGADGLARGFYKVAMRPGKPLMFGHFGSLPVLGLPGNPVSTAITARIFLRAAIEKLLGANLKKDKKMAVLDADLPENDERQDYIRAKVKINSDGTHVVTPFSRQDSAMAATLAKADCLIVRSPFAKPAKTGELVKILDLNC